MAASDPDTPQHDHPTDGAEPLVPARRLRRTLAARGLRPAAGRRASTRGEPEGEEPKEKLSLDVDVQTRSACERHVVTKISREDIDRFFDKEFSELMTSAQVPGFRPGHAPRKLVEQPLPQGRGGAGQGRLC